MKKGSFEDGVVTHAGFPNAAEDNSLAISLDQLVIRRRASTYLWRLGEAIDELGWPRGTIVVVDRALAPRPRDLVVAVEQEEFVIRRFHSRGLQTPAGDPIESNDVAIWGVVTYVMIGMRP